MCRKKRKCTAICATAVPAMIHRRVDARGAVPRHESEGRHGQQHGQNEAGDVGPQFRFVFRAVIHHPGSSRNGIEKSIATMLPRSRRAVPDNQAERQHGQQHVQEAAAPAAPPPPSIVGAAGYHASPSRNTTEKIPTQTMSRKCQNRPSRSSRTFTSRSTPNTSTCTIMMTIQMQPAVT